MNAAHKILTVSYGTFSCTLEGFEDPFNTMKAIAEYFRDLAAGDRYFGAEPPQPDAAMLHKIAEREIQARVEAKIQDNGVVLRAKEEAAAPPAISAPAIPQAEIPVPAVAVETADVADSEGVEALPPLTPAPLRAAPQLLAEDTAEQAMAAAAQRLSRLRAAAAASRPASLPPALPPAAAEPAPEAPRAPVHDPVAPDPDEAFLTHLSGALAAPEPEAEPEAEKAPTTTLSADTFVFGARQDAAPTAVASLETMAEIAGATETPEAQSPNNIESPAPADEGEAKVQRTRARVIKIRRIEPAAGTITETIPQSAPASVPDLSEHRQSRADRRQARATEASSAPRAEVVPAPAPVEAEDAAVRRLIDKANSELEEPQTKRRRSAIAHLKAAVLATVAERRAARPAKDETLRQDLYRRDLDEAMRPAPPVEKPAPLVLLPAARIEDAIRPSLRAVFPEDDELAAEMTNVFEDAPGKMSFRDFADRLGAHALPDLLEAAGAWLTLHRGQDRFTRPELFAQIGGLAEPSREDGLRGFGRLLREGRLTRAEGGQYALTETSPMLAQARKRAS